MMSSPNIRGPDDDELHGGSSASFSPMRRLALAVIAEAVHEAEFVARRGSPRTHGKSPGIERAQADVAQLLKWLTLDSYFGPWGEFAQVPPGQLRRRLAELAEAIVERLNSREAA